MNRHPRRIFRRHRWLALLYVVTLVLILAMSLTGIVSQSAAASEQTEERCEVTIKYHGQTTRTVSTRETAGQLLDRLGLTLSGEDVASHGMEDKVYDGMELQIDRIITAEETYSSVLSYPVTQCYDPTLPEGTRKVLRPGEDGELRLTAQVTYRNGVEAEKQIRSQTLTRAPVTEIVALGTARAEKTDAPVIADGFITLPTGEVLTYTGTATVRATAYTHTDEGCDLITATGTTVRWGTVAVDPRYIPYGTRMFIAASNGSYIYGIAVAEDCGGDIKGDRMDLYMPTYEQCMEFGRRVCTVYFLG